MHFRICGVRGRISDTVFAEKSLLLRSPSSPAPSAHVPLFTPARSLLQIPLRLCDSIASCPLPLLRACFRTSVPSPLLRDSHLCIPNSHLQSHTCDQTHRMSDHTRLVALQQLPQVQTHSEFNPNHSRGPRTPSKHNNASQNMIRTYLRPQICSNNIKTRITSQFKYNETNEFLTYTINNETNQTTFDFPQILHTSRK